MYLLPFVLAAVLASQSAFAETAHTGPKSEKLAVYTANSWYPDDLCIEVAAIVSVSKETPMLEKMQRLADELSRLVFGGKIISVVRVEERDGKQIAVVDLREGGNPESGWRSHYFQGSTGGACTGIALTRTFRQDGFDGIWPDGFYFLYEGKAIVEDDVEHVGELCEFHDRQKPLLSLRMANAYTSEVPMPRRMILTWSTKHSCTYDLFDFAEISVFPQGNWMPICKVEILEASGTKKKCINTRYIMTSDRLITESRWKSDIRCQGSDEPYEARVTLFESDTLHAPEWHPGSERYRVIRESTIVEKRSERIEKLEGAVK